jgi:CheY-like chemotaxis protein
VKKLKETANIHLLLIDDNREYLNELTEWLKIFKYKHITLARSAKEAYEKLNHPFDIIIADMVMEQGDSGFGVIDEVKRRNLSSVVIILTANDTVDDCRKAFNMGAWDYIRKNMRGNVFEEVDKSIQNAITYFNRWGNRQDERWIKDNIADLLENYLNQYVAVINNKVIGAADTREVLEKHLTQQKLPLFLTVIEKIEPPIENEDLRRKIEYLQTELSKSTKPVVYVEGKTDKTILYAAWKKLYQEKEMPYIIKDCDPLPQDSPRSAGGVGTLGSLISTIRADSANIVIGMFDRDKEGIAKFDRLPKYFKKVSEINLHSSIDAKVVEHNKAAAFLLPVPPGKEKYAEYLNFYIEFYFEEVVLSKKTKEGWGLEFRYPEIETRIKRHGEPVIKIEKSTIPETREIIDGKKIFSEKIVPGLKASKFEPFRIIFEQIEKLLEYLETKV